MAVTANQWVLARINVTTGNAEWLQISGGVRTWTTNSSNASLVARGDTARDIASDINNSGGSSDEWAVAVPALVMNSWTQR